jgi:hypothetical protein
MQIKEITKRKDWSGFNSYRGITFYTPTANAAERWTVQNPDGTVVTVHSLAAAESAAHKRQHGARDQRQEKTTRQYADWIEESN